MSNVYRVFLGINGYIDFVICSENHQHSNNLSKYRAILNHPLMFHHNNYKDNPVYSVKEHLQCRRVLSI